VIKIPDAVGDTCGQVRFATDEMMGPDGITAEGARDVIAMLLNCRLVGRQQRLEVRFLVALRGGGLPGEVRRLLEDATSKPVVGVSRFTSPDTMVCRSSAACSI
jgi:dimethylamine/trimethylamine dehydrogenase